MSDSRAIDQESRRLIREELLTNILVEAGAGSGKTQMLAERMAAGVAAGVYNVEHMAAVTFTRKAASELRGRFHLALEGELSKDVKSALWRTSEKRVARDSSRPFRISSASSAGRFTRSARGCCASGPLSPACLRVSRSLTRFRILELRQRVWRDFITSARGAGDPDMMALMEADIRPKDLDSAFATICGNDDVDFPAGEADCPDPKPARRGAREVLGGTAEHTCPPRIDSDTTCAIQKSGTTVSGAAARFATPSRPPFCRRVPAGHVGLRVEDYPEVVGRFSGREEAPTRPDPRAS